MKKWFTKEDIVKIRPWLLLGILVILFYLGASNLITLFGVIDFFIALLKPLFLAIAFAYILNIPMTFIERKLLKRVKKGGYLEKCSRAISLTLTLILAFIIVAFIGSIVIPKIFESMAQLFNNIGNLLQSIFVNIDEVLAFFNIDYRMEDFVQINSLVNMPWNEIFKNVVNIVGNSANGIWNNAMNVTSTFFLWFMAFMFSLYLLNGKETLLSQVRRTIIVIFKEKNAESLFNYGKQANQIFKSFITGQLMEACIIGTIYYFGMRLFGFPYPELIALMIAVFSLVPVFGPMCAMMIGAFLILSDDVLSSIWFIVFFQILSQLEDNLIYPKVVGKSVGLPGLWVMLSIFILGDLFGIVGMVTAVPLTAFLYTLFSNFVRNTLKRRNIEVDEDGFIVKDSINNIEEK